MVSVAKRVTITKKQTMRALTFFCFFSYSNAMFSPVISKNQQKIENILTLPGRPVPKSLSEPIAKEQAKGDIQLLIANIFRCLPYTN